MNRKTVKFKDYLTEQLKDPEFRKHFDAYDLPVRLAIRIAQERQKRKMTQKQLARKIGVSQQFIARLENSESTTPSLRTLEKVAQALDRHLYVDIR